MPTQRTLRFEQYRHFLHTFRQATLFLTMSCGWIGETGRYQLFSREQVDERYPS